MRTPHLGALFGFLLLAGCQPDVAYDPVAVAGDDALVTVGSKIVVDIEVYTVKPRAQRQRQRLRQR